jgi:uncharacterized protein DUF3800
MPVVVYVDENGDHSLEAVDPHFPIFVLTMMIADVKGYYEKIVPAICQLKFNHFGHEGVILHSRDIRKAQGDFRFLNDPAKREPFYLQLYDVMETCCYTIISVVIRKQAHKDKYGKAARNPYDLAFTSALERLLPLLEGHGQTEVQLIAEARGKREDADLKLAVLDVVSNGTFYIEASRFKKIQFNLEFRPKAMNIVGTQVADLAGYPIARYALDFKYQGPLLKIIRKKFYNGPGWVHGLKIFP